MKKFPFKKRQEMFQGPLCLWRGWTSRNSGRSGMLPKVLKLHHVAFHCIDTTQARYQLPLYPSTFYTIRTLLGFNFHAKSAKSTAARAPRHVSPPSFVFRSRKTMNLRLPFLYRRWVRGAWLLWRRVQAEAVNEMLRSLKKFGACIIFPNPFRFFFVTPTNVFVPKSERRIALRA